MQAGGRYRIGAGLHGNGQTSIAGYLVTWKGGMADEKIIISQNGNAVFDNRDVVRLHPGPGRQRVSPWRYL